MRLMCILINVFLNPPIAQSVPSPPPLQSPARARALGGDVSCALLLRSAGLGPMAGNPEPEGADKDDLLLLSEIFSASSLEESEFGKEWAAVFGDSRPREPAPTVAPGEPDLEPQTGSGFLPSQLLDQNMKDLKASLQGMCSRDRRGVSLFISCSVFNPKACFFLSFFLVLFSDLCLLSRVSFVCFFMFAMFYHTQ